MIKKLIKYKECNKIIILILINWLYKKIIIKMYKNLLRRLYDLNKENKNRCIKNVMEIGKKL
jgi:hypothetical protein